MRRTIFCATIIGYLIAATGFACAPVPAAAALQCAPTPKDCVALALNAMGGELVMDAVKRENLEVATVFAMHQEPVPGPK